MTHSNKLTKCGIYTTPIDETQLYEEEEEEEEETKSNFLGCYDPDGLAGISHTTITQKHTRIVVAYL